MNLQFRWGVAPCKWHLQYGEFYAGFALSLILPNGNSGNFLLRLPTPTRTKPWYDYPQFGFVVDGEGLVIIGSDYV
jgi:hypothetical protein